MMRTYRLKVPPNHATLSLASLLHDENMVPEQIGWFASRHAVTPIKALPVPLHQLVSALDAVSADVLFERLPVPIHSHSLLWGAVTLI